MHSRAVVRPSVSRPTLLRFSVCALFLLLGSLQAFAQSGQVSGTIKDPDQSVVSGAVVTLSNAHTAPPLQATTNASGQYTFSSVAPGTYRLEAHKAGFVTAVVP
jgi:iron complex outermembrane recepter protein